MSIVKRNMQINITPNQKAFTIIELIISASIIAVISLLVVANLRGSTQKSSLDNEAERLSSIIRQAHINSLIGLTVSGVRPAGGFGVHLTQCASGCRYILFADQNEDYLFNLVDDGQPLLSLTMLDNNVELSTLEPTSPLDIVFVPPRGNIFINGAPLSGSVTTTLSFANTSYSKKIILNLLTGRIDIE